MEGYKFDNKEHIHTLDSRALIGTSSMSSVLAKPGLTSWASGLACEMFGWTNKGNAKTGWVQKGKRITIAALKQLDIITMEPEEYLNLLDDAYSAHTRTLKKKAGEGTDMHEVMENYVKACIEKNGGKPIQEKTENPKLQFFADWALMNVKKFLWSEMHCYSRALWLGGISDCGYEDNEGKIVILDFKSSKDVYLSQFWQCIGYAIQIEENGGFTPGGDKVLEQVKIDYVAVLPFGMETPEVKFYYDMKGGAEAIKAMLLLYRMLS